MRAALAVLALSVCAAQAGKAESPRFNYILHCQGCHLADGSATPGKIPALVGVAGFLAAEGGREFLVRVPGVALSPIADDELADLVNWMLYRFSLETLPEDFKPYTAEEVARYRKNPLVTVDTARARLLAATRD